MKRNVYLLSSIAFIVNLGFGMAMPLLPFILLFFDGLLKDLPENLGKIPNTSAIALQTTILTAAFMITRAMLARYFGNLSDSYGRKKIIGIGLSLYTLLSFLYTFTTNWVEFLAIRAIQGVASAMVWPVAEAMVNDSVSWQERGKYMGWYMTFSNVSFFLGPSLGAFVYKFAAFYLGFSLIGSLMFPFYILTILAMSGLILSLFTIETIRDDTKKKIKNKGDSLRSQIVIPPEVATSMKIIYIMGFANGIAMGLVAPITNLYVIEYITADPSAIGLLSTVSGFAGFVVNVPSGYLSDKIGRKKLVVYGEAVARSITFIFPFIRNFNEILVLYSARSIAFNIMSPAYRALQADLVPKEIRGLVFGTVQSLFNFGAALSPIGGYFYQIASKWQINLFGLIVPGVALSFWLSALIGIFTTILFILYIKEPTKELKEKIS